MIRLATLLVLLAASALAHSQSLGRSGTHQGPRSEESVPQALPSLLLTAGDKLVEADGLLSWKVLTRISIVKHENTDGRFGTGVAHFAEPVVAPEVKALVGKRVKVKGYALPRSGDNNAGRVLISALPAIDEDGCTAGGAETFVDVLLGNSLPPKVNTMMVVEGTLTLFDMQSWGGYIYKLAEPRVISGT